MKDLLLRIDSWGFGSNDKTNGFRGAQHLVEKRETQHETLSNSANLRLKESPTDIIYVTVSHSFRIIKVNGMAWAGMPPSQHLPGSLTGSKIESLRRAGTKSILKSRISWCLQASPISKQLHQKCLPSLLVLVNEDPGFPACQQDTQSELFQLTKKSQRFQWTAEAQSAFDLVKNYLNLGYSCLHSKESPWSCLYMSTMESRCVTCSRRRIRIRPREASLLSQPHIERAWVELLSCWNCLALP